MASAGLRRLLPWRLDRLRWLNRFGALRQAWAASAGLAGSVNLGLLLWWLYRLHCLNRLWLFLLGRLLQLSQFLALHLQEFLQFVDILFENRQALLRILQCLVLGNLFGRFGGLGGRVPLAAASVRATFT